MKRSGLVAAVMVILAVGLLSWYLIARNHGVAADVIDQNTIANNIELQSTGLGFGAEPPKATTERRGAGTPGVIMVSYAPSPSFAMNDIHRVPLGTILDYAVEVVQYDEPRSLGTALSRNSRGQGPFVMTTPAEGAWGMRRETMREGHIVARIVSDGDYMDLGIVSGLNFLWVGNDPSGNLEWVLIPGTAFAPLKDLSERDAKRLFDRHAEVSSRSASRADF